MSERYHYCGLLLESELELPDLPRVTDGASPALRLRWGQVPDQLPNARRRTATWEHDAREALWRLPGVASYRISQRGRLIEVEPAAGAEAASVRLFLLQPVFALASLLRGEALLAASAVAKDDRVCAFVGPSASGKSSAAAVLLQRGWRLVSDSLLRIAPDTAGHPLAYPQAPWLWLWPDAIQALGLDLSGAAKLRSALAIRRLPTPTIERPLPLTRVAVLREQQGDDLELFETAPRHGGRAFASLLQQTAGTTWVDELADRRRLFQWVLRIATGATIERLDIPWGWQHRDRLADQLEQWCGRT